VDYETTDYAEKTTDYADYPANCGTDCAEYATTDYTDYETADYTEYGITDYTEKTTDYAESRKLRDKFFHDNLCPFAVYLMFLSVFPPEADLPLAWQCIHPATCGMRLQ
jgi:hypothetical protein